MTDSRKLLLILAVCCLVLTMGIPLEQGLAAPRTVLMELLDSEN